MENLDVTLDRQIYEAAHELKAFGIEMSTLTEAKIPALIHKDANGSGLVGDMGLPEKSTKDDPTLLIEREASFCTLAFATDGQGTAITWHRPDIYESSENLIDEVNNAFLGSEEKIILVTGTHEKRDQQKVRTFFLEKFPGFRKVYMFADEGSADTYPYSNLVYVPSSMSTSGNDKLLIGNVSNLTNKIRAEYPNLQWKYE